ncbi:MAG: hypothetical protein JWO03_2443 [Bacteroidetes bacterium]|nr:hypothetical protein [Bacteroidota bacterium]
MKTPILLTLICTVIYLAAIAGTPATPTGTSKWPGKTAFIDSCVVSKGISERTSDDPTRARRICKCWADKVEAVYPTGLPLHESDNPKIMSQTGAVGCLDVK